MSYRKDVWLSSDQNRPEHAERADATAEMGGGVEDLINPPLTNLAGGLGLM